jgi:hypothetical protein
MALRWEQHPAMVCRPWRSERSTLAGQRRSSSHHAVHLLHVQHRLHIGADPCCRTMPSCDEPRRHPEAVVARRRQSKADSSSMECNLSIAHVCCLTAIDQQLATKRVTGSDDTSRSLIWDCQLRRPLNVFQPTCLQRCRP